MEGCGVSAGSHRDGFLAAQTKDDAEGGVDFGGFSVEAVGTIARGADGVECRALQHNGTADRVGAFDSTGLRDDGVDDDGAFGVYGPGDGGVGGADWSEQETCGDTLRDAGGRTGP